MAVLRRRAVMERLMSRNAAVQRQARFGVWGAIVSALALSACAAFSAGDASRADGGPRTVGQRPNPPIALRAEAAGEGAGAYVFAWEPPREGAEVSFYYFTLERMDGAFASSGPVRIEAGAGRTAHLHVLPADLLAANGAGVRWSVRACNDNPAAALRGAPPGNCGQAASRIVELGVAGDAPREARMTFTIAGGAVG